MKFICIGAAIAAMVVSQSAAAEVPTTLRIVTESMRPSEISCGLTDAAVKASIMSAMRYNRVSLSTSESVSDTAFVYVNVNVMKFPDGLCAGSYDVSIRQWTMATPKTTSKTLTAMLVFCEAGGVFTRYSSAAAAADEKLKSGFEQCLADMSK